MTVAIDFPHVTHLRHAGGHVLWLRFSDGVEGTVDLTQRLVGQVFEPVRALEMFARARVDFPLGVTWPNGADLAPEALYEWLDPSGPVAKRPWAQLFDDASRREAADCAAMPELSRFFGIVIRMFWRENEAPHFHAQYGEHVASIDIATGAVTTRRFPGQAIRLVDDWRRLHVAELTENWNRMQRGEAPAHIAPLE
jgi:Domain of unknown function (DUF4160)/Protein of unknown function (DUF2442)